MFDPRVNNNFQNTEYPNSNSGVNPYQNSIPYAAPSMMMPPQTSPQNNMYTAPQGMNQDSAVYPPNNNYPFQQQEVGYPQSSQTGMPGNNYAEGGYVEGEQVKKSSKKGKNNPYPALAEMIRQQGKGEDTILAHINPMEALLLKSVGGEGSINPVTGLPQFPGGFFGNPMKWLKSNIGPALGTIIGNIILPGAGGIIGGALGGAAGSKLRGRNDTGQAAIRGGAIGAAAPSISSILGSGANMLGAQGAGSYLSNYGTQNAILPSLDRLIGGSGGIGNIGSASSGSGSSGIGNIGNYAKMGLGVSAGDDDGSTKKDERSFWDKLTGNTSNFLTDPQNLLATAVVGSSFFNRPKEKKEKTPEQLADEQKRYQDSLILSPEQLVKKERHLLAEEQMRRRVHRNRFLPEERFTIDPLYVKTNSPEEYRRQGKWLNYYNNPQFEGNPTLMKEGGRAQPNGMYEIAEMQNPMGLGQFLEGMGGGQDDNIRMNLPENSYIIDASTVSNLGDGNSHAGARQLEALVSNGEFYIPPEKVANLGRGNPAAGSQMLDKLVKNVRKHKGGSTKLPPKAKPLAEYMR